MKRSLLLTVVVMVVASQIAWRLDSGVTGRKIVAVDVGYLNYHETGLGDGYSYRMTLSNNSLVGKASPTWIELGVGLQYFQSDNPIGPTVEAVYVARNVRLIDYFPFAMFRLNIPALTFLQPSLGTRLGPHFMIYSYDLYDVSYNFNHEERVRHTSLGFDLFSGLRLGDQKFPLGAQVLISLSFLSSGIRDSAPLGLGTTAGIFYQF